MSNVVYMIDALNERRFKQLHEELKAKCTTYQKFIKSFERERGGQHIEKRAGKEKTLEEANIRRNLNDRHFAAVISHGKLRIEQCTIKGEAVTIAIEGIFKHFEGMCFETNAGFCVSSVFVRVVLRDTGGRTVLIVSAYPLRDENKDPSTPEVNYEDIWS